MIYGGNLLSICYTHFKSIFIAALVPVLKVYFYYKIEEIKNVCAFFFSRDCTLSDLMDFIIILPELKLEKPLSEY